MNEAQLKENRMALWCAKQDLAWRDGLLEPYQVEKLNDINFPFGSYIEDNYNMSEAQFREVVNDE